MLLRLPPIAVLASVLSACCLGAAWPLAAQARPAQVLLIRHGHKDGNPGNYNLSRRGLERSQALAGLIPACFGKVSRIVTYAFNPETGKNARSYQSAVALAVASGVNIRMDNGSESDSREAGRRILGDPADAGGLVVVFWEHRRLPLLAAGLGWATMPAMADDDFDTLDQLRYPAGVEDPVVRRFSQAQLLANPRLCPALPSLPINPAPRAPSP